jgi:predicted dehydrogenase
MIGTWPYMHADVSIASLDNGKHVLTEARMACNLEQAERMLAASHRHEDLVAQVVPAPFTLEVDRAVKELIGSGKLGRLREVSVTHTSGRFADPSSPLHWRQDFSLNGMNILSLGICHETILRWLDEEAVPVCVDGEIYTRARLDPESGLMQKVRIPDSLTVLGRLQSGARLVYHLSGVETGPGRGEIRLNAENNCLRFDMFTRKLFLVTVPDGEETPVDVPQEKRRGWKVEEDFINSIRTGEPVELTSFEEGLRYMRFTEAVWRAWTSS